MKPKKRVSKRDEILKEMVSMELNQLKGRGLFDFVKKVLTKAVPTDNPKNPDWDYKPKPGEHHAILKGTDGNFYRAQWAGPGTKSQIDLNELLAKHNNNISEALDSKNFVSDIDKESMAHDLRYLMSQIAPDPNDAVKKADEKFIEVANKLPDKINILPAVTAIKVKLSAENLASKFGKNRVAGKEEIKDQKLVEDVLDHLEMQGYGPSERPGRVPECEYCGSKAKNQTIHQRSVKCLNIQKSLGI